MDEIITYLIILLILFIQTQQLNMLVHIKISYYLLKNVSEYQKNLFLAKLQTDFIREIFIQYYRLFIGCQKLFIEKS